MTLSRSILRIPKRPNLVGFSQIIIARKVQRTRAELSLSREDAGGSRWKQRATDWKGMEGNRD